MIDWKDIILHTVLASAVMMLGLAFGPPWSWTMAFGISVIFIGREALQAHQKYGEWLWPIDWSGQKMLEAFCPTILAWVLALAQALIE